MLDSHVQVRSKILQEINDWSAFYGVDVSVEQVLDLAIAIHEELKSGRAFASDLADTLDYEDETYN